MSPTDPCKNHDLYCLHVTNSLSFKHHELYVSRAPCGYLTSQTTLSKWHWCQILMYPLVTMYTGMNHDVYISRTLYQQNITNSIPVALRAVFWISPTVSSKCYWYKLLPYLQDIHTNESWSRTLYHPNNTNSLSIRHHQLSIILLWRTLSQ